MHDHDHNHYNHPVVYAGSIKIKLDQMYRAALERLLSGVADNLKSKGYPLIGHIKMAAQDEAGNVFYTSIVDYTTARRFSGELQDLQNPVAVKINAVLYQVEQSVLQQIVDRELEILMGTA